MLELMRAILEQYGAQVTAVGGKEAIAVLTANPGEYDVLLSTLACRTGRLCAPSGEGTECRVRGRFLP